MLLVLLLGVSLVNFCRPIYKLGMPGSAVMEESEENPLKMDWFKQSVIVEVVCLVLFGVNLIPLLRYGITRKRRKVPLYWEMVGVSVLWGASFVAYYLLVDRYLRVYTGQGAAYFLNYFNLLDSL